MQVLGEGIAALLVGRRSAAYDTCGWKRTIEASQMEMLKAA